MKGLGSIQWNPCFERARDKILFVLAFETGLRPDERAFRAVREALDAPQSELFRELSVASLGVVGAANSGRINGAGDGDRTHDIQLGKLTFYR